MNRVKQCISTTMQHVRWNDCIILLRHISRNCIRDLDEGRLWLISHRCWVSLCQKMEMLIETTWESLFASQQLHEFQKEQKDSDVRNIWACDVLYMTNISKHSERQWELSHSSQSLKYCCLSASLSMFKMSYSSTCFIFFLITLT